MTVHLIDRQLASLKIISELCRITEIMVHQWVSESVMQYWFSVYYYPRDI